MEASSALISLLALGRFFLALGGLDTASAFGGMGSSREVTIAAIAEPAMMLSIFTVAISAGSTNLSHIIEASQGPAWKFFNPAHALAFVALFIVLLAETGRIPIDNPATHLELTMIHEAMILEYSGRYLALIEWAASLKQLVFMALLANVFFPIGIAPTWAREHHRFGHCLASSAKSSSFPPRWSLSRPPMPSCASSACLTCSAPRLFSPPWRYSPLSSSDENCHLQP